MEEEIKNRMNNIGALCNFLNKHQDYVDFIESKIIDLNEYDLPIAQKLYYYINKIDSPIICTCGKHRGYISFKNGFRKTCGDQECYVQSRRTTNIEKYGVDNPLKVEKFKQKVKDTILEKYDGQHYMNTKEVQDKFKSTMKERHGVEYAQQNKEIRQKSLDTWFAHTDEYRNKVNLNRKINNIKTKEEQAEIEKKKNITRIEKYGSLMNYHNMIQEKIRETSMERYGVDHFFRDGEIAQKRIDSYIEGNLDKIENMLNEEYELIDITPNKNNTDRYFKIKHNCGHIHSYTRQILYNRAFNNEEICVSCNPHLHGSSKAEKEILEFLKQYNLNIIENDRSLGKELDIYLPDFNLAIEHNGIYWHSEFYKPNNYHLEKTQMCEENNIQLMHIWEDQWIYKQDIVKSMILNKIGKTSNRIYARKCIIKEVPSNIASVFLDMNHLQGKVGSKVKLGLYYKNELVALMTFGSLRKNLGQKAEEDVYEMLRFCNRLNTNVIGGASKLFKHFIKEYNPLKIISYASRDYSKGNLYDKLGFTFDKYTKPNYSYLDKNNYIRMNRFSFRKDVLIKEGYDKNKTEHQIMLERNIPRVYDSGNYKFIYLRPVSS